jgi:hypothetical protein
VSATAAAHDKRGRSTRFCWYSIGMIEAISCHYALISLSIFPSNQVAMNEISLPTREVQVSSSCRIRKRGDHICVPCSHDNKVARHDRYQYPPERNRHDSRVGWITDWIYCGIWPLKARVLSMKEATIERIGGATEKQQVDRRTSLMQLIRK